MAITDPTDIASLRAWYDASDGATVTLDGSSHVTQWDDRSGLGYTLTSAGAIAVAAGHLNGLDTLRFPGSSTADRLLNNTSGLFGGVTSEQSYAFVVRFESINPGLVLNAGTDSGNAKQVAIWLQNNASSEISVIAGQGTNATTASDTALLTGNYYVVIMTASLDAATREKIVTYSINGVDDPTDDVTLQIGTSFVDNGNFRVGELSGFLLDGYIAELAVFNAVLTPGEISDLYDYLAAKWGFVEGEPSAGITFTDFADYRVIQRAPGVASKTVTLSGSYVGSPTAIEYRIVEHGADTPIAGHDWQTLDGAPVGGNFSGDVSVPQGGWYNLDLRFAGGSDPLFAGGHRWGVGVNVFMLGQSNMSNMKDVSSAPPAADPLVAMIASGSWGAPTGNGVIALGNALASALSLPVGLIEYAVSGSPISDWDPGSNWTAAMAGLMAAGGDCEFVLWHQGESDAIAATSKPSYKASLATVYAQCLTATGRSAAELPLLVGLLGIVTSPPYSSETDATWQAIQDAHLEFCAENATAYIAGNFTDLPHSNQLHYTGAGYETIAARYAQTILKLLGDVAYGGAGPRIVSATLSIATVNVHLGHDGGTDFTPASGITGFEVLDDGTPVTVSSAARLDANTIALELASVPAGSVTLRYQYGETPDISGVVKDNSALALPLIYANAVAVATPPDGLALGARRMAIESALAL